MTGRPESLLSNLPEWPGSPGRDREDVVSESARLCIECGLCCLGAFQTWAPISAKEIATFASTPIRPYGQEDQGKSQDRLGMVLPCACHRDGRCSIFPNRPEVCSSYVCVLLRATMNGSVSGFEARATAARTKAQFEWLRLAAEKLVYLSKKHWSVEMVLRDFCSNVYPRAKTVPLHPHEAEFARNAFEYLQNIDRHFERQNDLNEFVDLNRALNAPKPAFDVPPEQIGQYLIGNSDQIIELSNCTEIFEPLSAIVKGWDLIPVARDETSPAASPALRIWKNDGQYYWDMPYPGPHGGFEQPLSDPVDLLRQIHDQIDTLFALENPAHFFLRSAAVDIGNKLVLLVGKPATGKTTLSMALAARGHRLLGDDRIAVDSNTGRCVSVGTVPRVSCQFPYNEAAGQAGKLAKRHIGPHNNLNCFISLPDRLLASKGVSALASALVVMERSDQPVETAILPAKKSEMLKALIPLHYGNTLAARVAFDALDTCVDHAQLFTLRYNDIEDAADIIEQELFRGPRH